MSASVNADLLARTTEYALSVIGLYSTLPRDTVSQVLGRQFLRSGTSAGAQYREGRRAKSLADFISKSEGALQELEETAYWLELVTKSGRGQATAVTALAHETDELIAIFVKLVKTAKETKAKN
jgi:four helix bundle protein